MRILTRYILWEVFSHGVIGAALFTFVIFMRDVGRILELVVRNSAPIPSVAEIFFLTIPTALTFTLPMGVLVGILIGLSRMAADSEVTALRASGVGAWRFVAIIGIFAVGAFAVALLNNVVIAPRSAAALANLQNSLKTSQISFEVQPRVFYEDLKGYVLYVQDVEPASGAAVWRNVFLADISNPAAPKVTLAQRAIVVTEGDTMRMHLENGSQQETDPKNPDQYTISTFDQTDIPIPLPAAGPAPSRDLLPAAELKSSELLYRARTEVPAKARWYWIEFHRRLALAASCLVLMLVGIPLGLSSKKGGKSTGFVLTILLVFLYYFSLSAGIAFARQGKVPPALGVWSADILFALAGLVLLRRVQQSSIDVVSFRIVWSDIAKRFSREKSQAEVSISASPLRKRSSRFPQILDDYVLRQFLEYLGLILATFVVLTLVFTFFELLGDIIRNRIALITVGEYLLNVIPSMIYLMTPLSVLIAVLVTFGLLQKSNELTAMKATGISLYRLIVPVVALAATLSFALFLFDQFYLPHANKRQDALRNEIKGKPAQTYLNPQRKWIFGAHREIYYYEFFDSERNQFANLSVFSIDPPTFALTARTFASRVFWNESMKKWVFEQGWVRALTATQVQDYKTFDVRTFADIDEPPNYFKKEVKQSSEMNFDELKAYIRELEQGGFDVVRLRVQLYKKLSFPLITLVMSILAIPFAVSAGRQGALRGVATAIGIAVVYWIASGLFEAMGNVNQLPAALAAWSPDVIFGLAGGYFILKVPT
ncbi:MAG TPA: LptF/LptG family permease [Terriglobales bacterium]|jgi:LPS export ABC transporter permease LptG/LPS export ABC transporter permease LptF|nr:LptF/LptG family permease [Terriglobales bacterium]